MKRVWLGIVGLVASTSCHPRLDNLDRNGNLPETSENAIIILAAPPNVMLFVYPGIDDGVNWHCESRVPIRLFTSDGWIVAKVWSRTRKRKYAIVAAGRGRDGMDMTTPRSNGLIPVFNAPPGNVTFLGTLDVQRGQSGFRVAEDRAEDSVGTEEAVEYLAANYPRVRSPVVRGHVDWIYMPETCLAPNIIIVPIMLP